MGSPDFAVPSLEAVAQAHELVAVVTQPDRPRGRGRSVAAPAVKIAARSLDVEILQPERIRGRAMRERLMRYRPDLIVVVAFGQILSPRLLEDPPLGCINVHGSLLPAYRGPAPIQWAVLRGESRSGVTTMRMAPGVDTGPMLLSRAVALRPDETAGSLQERLAPLGAELLLETLDGLRQGALVAVPQDDRLASQAPLLRKEDGWVDFARPAREVDCWIRGMDPWPGAFCALGDERIKLFRSRVVTDGGAPGEVLACDDRGLLVACGEGAVWIAELQRPGRRRLAARDLAVGRAIPAGTQLGAHSGS